MASEVPNLPPVEALAYFRRKGLRVGFAWQDVWQADHARAFTVAKAMSTDLLEEIRSHVDRAIAEGRTLAQFQDELRPFLEARGWWGRKVMIDPLTGQRVNAQLGSPRRLRTIFQVNMRSAYQAGRWERMQRNAAAFPFVRYLHSGAVRKPRPEHVAWHGTIKPINDPWWDTHYPPCGWGCKCTAIPVNQRMMDRRGWTETERPPAFLPERYVNPRTGEETLIEAGIDPGFNFNVGRAYLDDLAARPIPSGRRAAGEGAQLTEAQRADAFLAPFGMGAGDRQGAVFIDDVGHPLAISPAMARSAAGFSAGELTAAGRAIAAPDEIRELWSADLSSQPLLTRAYVAGDIAVLVNKAGWRVVPAGRRAGELLGRGAAEGWVADVISEPRAKRPIHRLGEPAPRVRGELARLGIEWRPREVALDRDFIVHIMRRHGGDSRGQQPIGPADIALARVILGRGEINNSNPRVSRKGVRRILATAMIGGARYQAAFEIRNAAIVLVHLRKR